MSIAVVGESGQAKQTRHNQPNLAGLKTRSAVFFSEGLNVSTSFNKNTAPHAFSRQSAVP